MIKNRVSYIFDLLIVIIVALFLFGALSTIFAPQAHATDDLPQEQLCEEQIGRRIDVDNQAYVVISVNENCEPVLELIQEDSPLWDCKTMGNFTCGELIDGVWWIIHYENGCEVSRELRYVVPAPPVETAPPAEPAPVVTQEVVTEIADAVEVPQAVGTPQLASTGVPVHILVVGIIALLVAGWVLLVVGYRGRRNL